MKRYSDLLAMSRVRLIGDIAHYYLRYIDDIYAIDNDVKFICLKRDREKTIESWLKKSKIGRWRSKWVADYLASLITREPFYQTTNPWIEHDGKTYAVDPVWDKCFPKYDARDIKSAVGMYYDDYYERVERLLNKYPDNVWLTATEKLNTPEGQTALLDFVGYPSESRVRVDAHIHKSKR